jgi:hypothetical protein
MFSVQPISAAPLSDIGLDALGVTVLVTGLSATGGVGSVTVIVPDVTVEVTGLSATGSVGSVTIIVAEWTPILPNQDANWIEIVPTQDSGWTKIK